MTRYDSARLHTAREYNHLPFDRTFPLPYQEFLTKYDLARGYKDWVENFGIDRHIRFDTTLESGSWDEGSKTWTLNVRRRHDATIQTLTCRHVVMATGGGGQIPIMPTYPGRDEFQGTVLHSADYRSAEPWRGKAGVVVGTANTAHDVAEDMAEAGLGSVTMVQRTRTYVLPCEYFKTVSDRSYNAGVPTIDADREGYSMPYAVTRLLSRKTLHGMAAQESERFDALERAGFRVERFGDIMYHICEKLGGHYMDVGCSDKIAKGLVSHN
jgi:cation diffusion facilitator CzcD-associated flavoprotein CzcO